MWSMLKFPGERPENLGVHEGHLAPCGPRSSCVCSEYETDAAGNRDPHHVPPLAFDGDPYDAMTRLVAVLLQRSDARIVTQTREYLHAEFESRWFGLIDDIEFLLKPEARVIHVRAASRHGLADLGINRTRVETLREAFDEAE